MRLVALTGYRYCGKSTFARFLQEELYFTKVHTFASGLAACKAYWISLGVNEHTATRLVYGDLKDVPFTQLLAAPHLTDYQSLNYANKNMMTKTLADFLPGESCRAYMEEFGNWMGTTMGRDYTLLAEIKKMGWINKDADLVVESIVYEADDIHDQGGIIIRLDRDEAKPRGLKTDKAVDEIKPDLIINNNLPLADLRQYIRTQFLSEISGLLKAKSERIKS